MIEYTVKVYSNGNKSWYFNGELHREDGPAIEYSDGYKEWYLNGEELIEEEFNARMKPSTDNVNNPSHYGQGNIEAITYIEDVLTEEEYVGYLRGNIAKYLHRWRWKGKPKEDLDKANWYLARLREVVKDEGVSTTIKK